MSLLFNRLGGCCCRKVPTPPPVRRPLPPILRFIIGLVLAVLLFGLGIFFIFSLFGLLPVLIIVALVLLIIALILFR